METGLGLFSPDFPGLNTFTTVVLKIHIADFPYTPWLCHPHILSTVTVAWHHFIYLTDTNSLVTYLMSQGNVKFSNNTCKKYHLNFKVDKGVKLLH